MSDINTVVMTGRLVRDPIIRNNGMKMGYFSIASNRRYRDKTNALKEETAFMPCKCFGGWTDALEGHKTGELLIVQGRLRTETWNNEGRSISQLILICDSVRFLVTEPRSQQRNGRYGDKPAPRDGGHTEGEPPF